MEAIEKPVWLKGSGLERIRDASRIVISTGRATEIRDGRDGRETVVVNVKEGEERYGERPSIGIRDSIVALI